MKHNKKNSAFTLIELSIVLVIIGLIVGGILVGQDLIKAGAVRAQIKQIYDIETQMNVFRDKYGCLPGDCANATTFFGTTDANGYTVVNGDGDGFVWEKSSDGSYSGDAECLSSDMGSLEIEQLFLHLKDANLTNYGTNGTSNVGAGYPATSLNPNAGIIVTCLGATSGDGDIPTHFKNTGQNAIILGIAPNGNFGGRIRYHMGEGNPWLTNGNGMAVTDMNNIDIKIDDGLPSTGNFGVLVGCVGGTSSYKPTSSSCTLNSVIMQSSVVIAGKLIK